MGALAHKTVQTAGCRVSLHGVVIRGESPGIARRVRRALLVQQSLNVSGAVTDVGTVVHQLWRDWSERTAPLARAVIVVLLAACVDGPSEPAGSAAEIVDASVVSGPHNLLSGVVHVRVRGADEVAVVYALDGATNGDSITPRVPVTGDSAVVPVLGLLPERRYELRVVAYAEHGTSTHGGLTLTTGALPDDLPSYTATGADASPGYVVMAAGLYGLVIDNTGRVVWYRRFPNGPGLNFAAQPNGHYVARPPAGNPANPGHWVEIDALGNETRVLPCSDGLRPRPHDLIAQPDGSYWLLCDESRAMDLTAFGGVADAVVTGTAVQHIGRDGATLFRWSPFDHFAITDVDAKERTGAAVNWTHGNALDLDTDGNLIVSFRNLGEVTKIDVATGNVIWRFGGRRNQFDLSNASGASVPSFVGQHSARAYAPGAILLLDNIGDPNQSRAERYVLDERARSARLVRSYGSGPGVVTLIGGSVQDLPDDRTLVSFGTAGRVEEYDASGRVVWRIDGNPGYVFRAQRIRSLYAPGVGLTR